MSLPSPNLDDRTFDDLVRDAVDRVRQTCPEEWTDLSPGDPGRALLEAFAYITETMIYRLNRLPVKVYQESLNLMGVHPYPPTAACALLEFKPSETSHGDIDIPAGTRVAVNWGGGTGGAPVFVTAHEARMPKDKELAHVMAYHCEWVKDGERVGLRTGQSGPTVQLSRSPVIANTGTKLDLRVRVEARRDEQGDGVKARTHEGKTDPYWREVTDFLGYEADGCVYVADRYSGQITFPGKSPPRGWEIRVWYAHGGGPAGNVPAGVLTVLRDSIPGIGAVSNPSAATGGRAAETLEDMRLYGPQGIHCQERAITARDFETLARRASGEVARAKAIAQAERWKHGERGTVEVLLVPDVPAKERRSEDQVTVAKIGKKRIETVREQVQAYLDARRPMGVRCEVKWAQLKTVSVRAKISVRPKEDSGNVIDQVRERLYQYINPLPAVTTGCGTHPARRLNGWPFGRPLHWSDAYREVQAVEGVQRVDDLKLIVENMPDGNLTALASDQQTGMWYAACGNRLFRSENDGDGWELLKRSEGDSIELRKRFEDESIELVRAHPRQAGLVAAVATMGEGDKQAFRVYVSHDCGEEWRLEEGIDSVGEVHDIAWMTNQRGAPVLLLAAANGLFALAVEVKGSPQCIVVDRKTDRLGFYAVAVAHKEATDQVSVAVAARNEGGVFLCRNWRDNRNFEPIAPKGKNILWGKDIRVLAVQRGGKGDFLWAGAYAEGPADEGDGCYRRALDDLDAEWERFGQDKGWEGGSCRALAFLEDAAVAASHHGWVLRLDLPEGEWEKEDRGDVPRRDDDSPRLVTALAAMKTKEQDRDITTVLAAVKTEKQDGDTTTVLAATEKDGLYRSRDGGRYEQISKEKSALSHEVTLPQTWLFCSGQHTVDLTGDDDESQRD